jgi:Ca-activated chloride channel family protein
MDFRYHNLDWRELANQLARDRLIDEVFRELMLATNGDVEQALKWLESAQGKRFREQSGISRDDFEKRLIERKQITKQDGKRVLTSRGERDLRSSCLESVFGKLKSGPKGDHLTNRAGRQGDATGVLRPWQPGDESKDIAYRDSILSSLRQGHDELHEDDLLIDEREESTSAATVMLIDVSHSMTLYGEDRITPAKRVAMAFAELQRRRYPRDSLNILLFGDDVEEVQVKDLPYISNGPYHTNTCEALRRAAEILIKKHQSNKRVVMITDGKPSALLVRGQLMINSSGLDPEIVAATLKQGARYPRLGVELTVFMVASDPYLERFIAQLVEVSQGAAFRATLSDLGAQVMSRIFGERRS